MTPAVATDRHVESPETLACELRMAAMLVPYLFGEQATYRKISGQRPFDFWIYLEGEKPVCLVEFKGNNVTTREMMSWAKAHNLTEPHAINHCIKNKNMARMMGEHQLPGIYAMLVDGKIHFIHIENQPWIFIGKWGRNDRGRASDIKDSEALPLSFFSTLP